MADFDWRVWLKQTLDARGSLVAKVPVDRIISAGSHDDTFMPDDRPFIVIRVGTELRGPFPGVTTHNASIWVHDEPGTYMNIDSILKEIKAAIEGPVTEDGAVSARWIGDSQELSDDILRTIVRNSSFQLNGKG